MHISSHLIPSHRIQVLVLYMYRHDTCVGMKGGGRKRGEGATKTQQLLTHTIQHIERNPLFTSLCEKEEEKRRRLGPRRKEGWRETASERYVYNTVSPRSENKQRKEEKEKKIIISEFRPQGLGPNSYNVSVFIRLS